LWLACLSFLEHRHRAERALASVLATSYQRGWASRLGGWRSSPRHRVTGGRNDEWTESRRYMGLDILAACRKAAQADMGKDKTNLVRLD